VELRPRMRRSRAFLNLNLNLLSALEIKSKSMIKIRKHERSRSSMPVQVRSAVTGKGYRSFLNGNPNSWNRPASSGRVTRAPGRNQEIAVKTSFTHRPFSLANTTLPSAFKGGNTSSLSANASAFSVSSNDRSRVAPDSLADARIATSSVPKVAR